MRRIVVLVPLTDYDDSSKIHNLQSQIVQLNKENANLNRSNTMLQISYDTAYAQQSKLKAQVSDLTKQVDELNWTISSQNTELVKLKETKVADTTALTQRIGQLQTANDGLNIQVALLTKQLTPSPDHALTWTQVQDDPDLRSIAWTGSDHDFQRKVEEIGTQYHASHVYIENETDFNDMAIDIWNMLLAQSIKTVIVVGNLDNPNATFNQCNHAWLRIFDYEGKYCIIEPATGEVIYGINNDGTHNPQMVPYYGGWPYKKPSDLRSDLMKKW